MIVFAYGLSHDEPNPCNLSLGRQANTIAAGEADEVKIAAQWENALRMKWYDLCIGPFTDRYLGSAEVVQIAKEVLFDPEGITSVIPVAQTFLNYRAACAHISAAGLTVVKREIKPVGHCHSSLQPWTRSAGSLLVYAVRQKLTGDEGRLIVTDQMRELAASGLPPKSQPRPVQPA